MLLSRGLDERKLELLLRIHENGMRAMLGVTKHDDWKSRPHNTSYFDCIIGARLARMAYDRFTDAPEPVRNFLRLHHVHELCHCTMERRPVAQPLADRISGLLEKILNEHGLVAYLACAPLTAERSAFGVALFGQFNDDPHTTTKGGLDEFYHTTTPLLLLAYLAPSEEELEQALRDQGEVLQLMKVPSTGLYAPSLEVRCTLAGREAHNV
ncbi:MAG TPA: hypothetical protein VFG07_06635 [Thermoplasmata archaeon]|nr:hypothetical protein [Thermoplasmata archaeon]